MRWTKFSLLIFGVGLGLGLVVVVTEIDALARLASLLMVFGILAVPVGALLDWLLPSKPGRPTERRRGGRRTSRGGAASVRRRGGEPPFSKR